MHPNEEKQCRNSKSHWRIKTPSIELQLTGGRENTDRFCRGIVGNVHKKRRWAVVALQAPFWLHVIKVNTEARDVLLSSMRREMQPAGWTCGVTIMRPLCQGERLRRFCCQFLLQITVIARTGGGQADRHRANGAKMASAEHVTVSVAW